MAGKTLVTTFDDVEEAEQAVQKLQQDGFADDDVGWVTRGPGGREIAHGNLVEQQKDASIERSAVGGVLGGLAGFLLGATALTLLDGVGAIVVAGPLVSAAAGAGVGAALGKMTDRVAHHPEVARPQAHRYAARLGKGEAAVTVRVENEEQEARALEILRGEASLHRHGFMWRVPALHDEGRSSRFSLY